MTMPPVSTTATDSTDRRATEQDGSTETSNLRNCPSGIVNPLENGHVNSAGPGRIWFSTVMSEDMSGTPVAATGEVNSSSIDATDGWPESLHRHRSCRRVDRLWALQAPFKDLQKQYGQWSCFLCCHVRTGTIVIGLLHLLWQLLALSLIAFVMIHPNILAPKSQVHFDGEHLKVAQGGTQDVQAVNCSEMPCLLATQRDRENINSANDIPYTLINLLSSTHRLNSEDLNVALFVYLCTFVVTLLLIYGAFKGQPSYLMPFFFLQVFYFCISSMSMIGYLSYLPSVRQAIEDSHKFPMKSELLAMNSKCLTFFVMLFCILNFMTKAYIISVIWRCYKYLMHKDTLGRWPVCTSRTSHLGPVDQESQTLVLGHDLPDYDTAITDPQYRKKVSALFPEPPPSYDMAMAAYQVQQRIIEEAQQARGFSEGGQSSTFSGQCSSETGEHSENNTVERIDSQRATGNSV